MNIRWSYLVLTVSAILSLALAVVCWWLGWLGIGPSVIGFVVIGGAVLLCALEWSAWHLADTDHNFWSVVVAHVAAAVMFGFFLFLMSNIGWKAAGASVGVMVLWAASAIPSFITVRTAINRVPEPEAP